MLRSTAADNERQFGSEVSDTLKKFYVDDIRKSVNTVQEAVTLIRNVARFPRCWWVQLDKIHK